MNLSNLFQNKAYVIPEHLAGEDSEIKLVSILLKSLDPPIFGENIKFLSETEDYDVYKYSEAGFDFRIKISLDPKCEKINRESLILNGINPLIRAKYIKDGVVKIGDELRYIITSNENAENLSDLGLSYFTENFASFCESYSLMQQSQNPPFSYKEYLEESFGALLSKNFTEDSIESIKNYTDFKLISEIIERMEGELLESCNNDLISKGFVCHGNLNRENIISKNGLFKFINFDHSHRSHCFLDLNDIFIELGVPEEMEFGLLSVFCSHMNITLDKEALKLYKKCQQASLMKKGLELVIGYLKEVYLYGSRRVSEIVNISDRFSLSYDRYMSIPHFKNNEKFILKTITEPILNQKA
jgi:hypothetical protein